MSWEVTLITHYFMEEVFLITFTKWAILSGFFAILAINYHEKISFQALERKRNAKTAKWCVDGQTWWQLACRTGFMFLRFSAG